MVFSGESPYAVMVMDLDPDSDQVTDIFLVTNPDKLTGVAPQDPAPGRGDGSDGRPVPEERPGGDGSVAGDVQRAAGGAEAMCGWAAGSSQAITRSRASAGTDTQPAVAPLP